MSPPTANPTRIGKYEVESVIGRGGMGVVYRAHDPQLGRLVAIKMIISGGDQELLTRFVQEAKSTGRLQSPNIVTVYDFGEQDGNPYLVMEFIEGTSLETIIKAGAPLTLAEKLGIIIDVCAGLSYAHEQGVIHRDMKPANIMVLKKDGTAKIVDFGIARIGGARLTRTDQVIGSVDYMSPEQLQNKHLDHRTDIFSTAVVLYQLLTGQLPFHGNETAATLYKIVYEPPPPLDLAEFPPELQAALNRALAKSAQDRYETARDFALDLIQVQERQKQETVAQYMRRAQAAMQRHEWAKAGEQLQLVLRIDRQNTTARRLNTEVQERIRQQQRVEQARHLRAQADQALAELRYEDALQLVNQALSLDEGNPDLQSLRETVLAAKQRAGRLQQALRRAETAQQEGDIEGAMRAIDEAIAIDPNDTQARALQVILRKQAEEGVRQDQLRQLLEQARAHIAARELGMALDTLKIAEALDPASPELATVAKLALAAREQEKRRQEIEQLRRLIEDDLVREDYAAAISKAEEGLRKSPLDQSLLKLKTLAEQQRFRGEQKAFVREQGKAAGRLMDRGQLLEAVALIEQALGRVPRDPELEGLRDAINQRLSSERDARQIEELAVARRRAAAEDLDRQLAQEASPDARVLLAQEALRTDPANEFLRQRLASLLELQRRLAACVENAQRAELARNYPEAIREWRRLQQEWPRHPNADAEIQRLTKLAQPPKPSPPPVAPPPPREPEASATRLFTPTPAPPPPVAPPVAPPTKPARMRETKPPAIEPGPERQRLPVLPAKLPVIGAAVGVVLVAALIYAFWPSAAAVKVRLQTDPPESVVSAAGKNCLTPCALELKPGEYEIRAVHDGYEIFTQQTKITSQTTTLPTFVLRKLGAPTPNLGTLVVQANVDEVDVFIDGALKGQTGPSGTPFTVATGHHEVRVEKSGYAVETPPQAVEIAKDSKASLPEFLLRPSTTAPPPVDSYVIVHGIAGAAVTVDHGAPQTISGDGTLSIKIKPGSHVVGVLQDGYQPWSKNVKVKNGERQSVEAVLTPLARPPRIDKFSSNLASIEPGQQVTLTWQTQNATTASINGIGPVTPSGSVTVTPNSSTTYTLRAEGPGGPAAEERASVTVTNRPVPKPTAQIDAQPSAILSGQTSTLVWQTQNATSILIENGSGSESVASSGSKQVSPDKTTTYTLMARGASESVKSQATITVTPKPQEAQGKPTLYPDLDKVKAAIENYREAYETLSIAEVRKAWPGIPKKKEKALDDSFKGFRAIKLKLEYGQPKIEDNSAEWPCRQTLTYTATNGTVQPAIPSSVVFVLRKSGGTWYVQDMHGQ